MTCNKIHAHKHLAFCLLIRDMYLILHVFDSVLRPHATALIAQERLMYATLNSKTATEPDFLEMALLLPRWQVLALEDLARSRGLNIGQMLRRLIGDLLRERGKAGS